MNNQYYIGDVAKRLGIHEQTIRSYERRGLIKPQRTVNNTRIFSEKDILKITNIITLTEEFGMNLVGVKFVFSLTKKLEMNEDDIWDFMQDHKKEFIK